MKKLKFILQHRYYLKITIIFFLFLIIAYISTYEYKSIYTGNETEFIGKVYKLKKDNKLTIYIKSKEKLIINSSNENLKINIGDTIYIKGKMKLPNKNSLPNIFNYQNYLKYNQIYYIVDATQINVLDKNKNIIYYLKDKISNRINNIAKSNEYINVFLLGDNSKLSEKIIESYRQNGISHLFSISGMHISLFASIIFYVLKRISYNNYYNYGVVITFLIFYVSLIDSSPSALRSLVMYILFSINKVFNLKINKLDIMGLALITLLIINPFYIYNMSFQFSYLISLSLIIFSYKYKNIKSYVLKSLYISLISFLVSFPICIYNFYQVNIFSIFLNIILIPLVSIIIFPLSIISFILPSISYVLNIFISLLETISIYISNTKIGIMTFSKPNILLILIYYLNIYLFLHNFKYFYLFIIILFHKTNVYLDYNTNITFIDVGQGDSIFLKLPNNNGNILIDTGGNINSNYKIMNNKIIPYFKSVGIARINYLIITHGDYDHVGEAINLVENFKVEKVIFNCGEFNDLEKDLIKVLDKKKIPYYSCIKELNIDDNKLYFLNNKDYGNENDNSSVIYTELNNHKFLFMGDAGVEVEEDLIKKYNLQDIDVLKVGHHGSKTSSSKNFIDNINPEYSIISVGKNNRYGHPNKEVINNLDNSKIYRTDQDGSIMFKIKNTRLEMKSCIRRKKSFINII